MVGSGPAHLVLGDVPGHLHRPFVAVLTHLPPDDIVPYPVGFAQSLYDPAGPVVEVETGVGEREDEPSLRAQDPRNLPDGGGRVPNVLESHVRHDPVKAGRLETGQTRRIPFEELGARRVLALPSERIGKGRPGPLDPHGPGGTLPRPSPREVAVATGEVEDPKTADRTHDP